MVPHVLVSGHLQPFNQSLVLFQFFFSFFFMAEVAAVTNFDYMDRYFFVGFEFSHQFKHLFFRPAPHVLRGDAFNKEDVGSQLRALAV
jgi:hypothetical protein